MTQGSLAVPAPQDPDEASSTASRIADLEVLFRAEYNRLYGVAYHYVRSRAVAEEVVQDAFLHLWTHRAEWGHARDLSRYMAAAVRNRALDHVRRQRLEVAWQQRAMSGSEDLVLSQFARESSHGRGQGRERDIADGAERVRAALGRLPERTQETMALRVYRQLTNGEIAEVMGITVKAVERNITRAMHALRAALADERESG